MKTIWIVDHYSSEPQHGGISRQYDFARQLSKVGFRVVVIASAFSHFTHSFISSEDCCIVEFVPNSYYVYLRTLAYKKNNSFRRAYSMFDFLRQVNKYSKLIVDTCGEPDAIIGCSIHPLAWIAAYRIAKKYNIRFCVEVRDFWPHVWIASGEKSKYNPMVMFFDVVQKWAFKKADRIIYSMYDGDKYICDKLGYPRSKVALIGQPMDCDRFDENRKKMSSLPLSIRQFISGECLVCSFAGYYMEYEGVYVILEAVRLLGKKNIPVKLIFVGSGEERDGMQRYIQNYCLSNVLINDRIPKNLVPALLSLSDICIAHLEVKGHKEANMYGVSKNKVNEYLYSGACTLFGYFNKNDPVSRSGGGIIYEPFDAVDLATKIEEIYKMSVPERKQFGINGRKYIKENHSVEVLGDKLTKVLFD